MKKTPATKSGGTIREIIGEYTTGRGTPRSIKVKHYEGGQEIHIGIGPTQGNAKGSAKMSPEVGEELAEAIYEAVEEARECGG